MTAVASSWPLRGAVRRAWNYAVWERNPFIQILYVALMGWCKYAFVTEAYPFLPNPYAGEHHKWISLALYVAALALFLYMCRSDPGVITPANIHSFKAYPHHPVLFPENKYCRTCKTLKLPRSKHCRVCNHCVARFDHHCIWFSACVGVHNYGAFILFLLSQLGVTLEAFYVTATVFISQANALTLDDSDEQFREAIHSVVANNQPLGFVAAASLMVSVVVWFFLLVQLRRIILNVTASESFKRDALRLEADPDNATGAKRLFNMLVATLPATPGAETSRAEQKKALDASWGGLFSPDTILNTEERFTKADVEYNPYNLGSVWLNVKDAFQGRAAAAASRSSQLKKIN